MRICVSGWYFREDFFDSLHRLNEKYPVTVISHREPPKGFACDFPIVVIPDEGLDMGAYDYYLQNHWDGKSDVLFCHDDVIVGSYLNEEFEVFPGEKSFDGLSRLSEQCDQAYVFTDRTEDARNYGKHGRMIFTSAKFLLRIKEKGIWYDKGNRGYTGKRDEARPKGCLHYNAGIEEFHKDAALTGLKVHFKAYAPAIKLLIRGQEVIPSS